jgi:hypothetical protein
MYSLLSLEAERTEVKEQRGELETMKAQGDSA